MKHHGLTRDEAELEYLKIVQDFEMSGVNYFKITVCVNLYYLYSLSFLLVLFGVFIDNSYRSILCFLSLGREWQ